MKNNNNAVMIVSRILMGIALLLLLFLGGTWVGMANAHLPWHIFFGILLGLIILGILIWSLGFKSHTFSEDVKPEVVQKHKSHQAFDQYAGSNPPKDAFDYDKS